MLHKIALVALVALAASAAVIGVDGTQVSLSVTSSTDLVTSGGFWHDAYLTVTWNATDIDEGQDFVSIWWVPFAGTYIEFRNVTTLNGSETFHVVNGRHPFIFRYIRGNTVLSESQPIQPDGTYPMQVHAMFDYTDVTQMRILWTTNRTTGTETVQYGIGTLSHTQLATQNFTYTHDELNTKLELPPIAIRTEMFDNIGLRGLRCKYGECYNDFTACEQFVDPGVIHMATLTGLKPNTIYQFQVGEADGKGFSSQFSFRTRQPATDSSQVQILYVADAGVGASTGNFAGGAAHNDVPIGSALIEGGEEVWDAILRDPQLANDQATIMNGDISYARGWPWSWELFHNETEKIFTTAPVIATYGNHEFDYSKNPFEMCAGGDSGGEAGIVAGRRFNLDENTPWFITEMGPVTLVGMSSEHSIDQQREWLLSVLPAVNRQLTPWLVVFFHRPIYQSNTYANKKLKSAMRDGYGDLFTRYGVDLVLTGHSHYYERMCAVSAGHCAKWGYRDAWDHYWNVAFGPNNCTYNKTESYYSEDDCRTACMYEDDCTGVQFYNGTCTISTCPQPIPLQWDRYNNIWSLTRLTGQPPIYIVDGTAGGVSVPESTPYSDLTQYKDFMQFGYSRIKASTTSLLWEHYHIDGSVVDSVTLTPVNAV